MKSTFGDFYIKVQADTKNLVKHELREIIGIVGTGMNICCVWGRFIFCFRLKVFNSSKSGEMITD